MPISALDIRNVVTREDDFGHEMRVGRAIRGVPAMELKHGGTYTDPVTQKPRQFDYRCWLKKESACLSVAVECKNLSPTVPLVMCGTKRRENEAFHDLIEARKGLFRRGAATIQGLSSITRRASREHSFYPLNHFVGKSLVRIQSDKTPMVRTQDADIYDKWAQALSSAVGLVKSACRIPQEATQPRFFSSVLPIVVVPDGVLWIAEYDEGGNIFIDPVQVEECELFVDRTIELGKKYTPTFHRFTFSHVHFFTLAGFSSFLSKMAVNDHAWTKLFTDKSMEI